MLRFATALAVIAACVPAHAQLNLDFETPTLDDEAPPGWRVRDSGTDVALDASIVRTGTRSLRVASTDASRLNRFSQSIETREISENRVRIIAHVKTSSEADATAALWIRIEGDGGLLYFDSTRAQSAGATPDWTRREIEAPIPPRALRLTFGGELSGTGTAWFDDFSIVPVDAGTLPAPSAEATRYVEQALAIIEANAVGRPDLSWAAFYDAVMAQARGSVTATDGYLAIRFALASLADGHSYFMTPRQMTALETAPAGNARTGRAPIAPHGENVAESIAYIRLPGFAGGTHTDQVEFAETVQQIIRELDSTGVCGWILDLRNNLGGNLWPMLAGVGPLLGDGEMGASLAPNGERRTVWYESGKAGLDDFVQLRVRGEPHRLREENAPVAVLVNSSTASAGEILAIAFAARPATRSFGTATRGATTVTRVFPLRDGAALVLAVANTSDRHGRVYTSSLAPDEPAPESDRALPLRDQPAVGSAVAWLRSHEACSTDASR